MTEAIETTQEQQTIVPTGNDLVVIADKPQEMVEAQHVLIGRVASKLEGAGQDLAAAEQTLEVCKTAELNVEQARRLVRRARDRVTFLEKVREALEAGYVIVPGMQAETIAIRVKRAPRPNLQEDTYRRLTTPLQPAEVLPAGEGKYVSPVPMVQRSEFKKDDGKTYYEQWAVAWDEEIGLPVDFVKPVVVERTGKMLARKLFDEVAVAPVSWNKKGMDPMVIGRIYDRSRGRTPLTFLVAWFIDTSTI